MDDKKDDIKSIIDDMVVFSDDMPEDTKIIPVKEILKKSEEHEPKEAEPEEESNTEEPSEETQYVPEEEPVADYDEDYDFDFDHEEDEIGDDELVVPMLKPILKRLIPLFAVLLVLVWGMTTSNSIVKNYRKNFTANLAQLAENLGIATEKAQDEPQEFYAEGLVEYRESSKNEESAEDAQGAQYRADVESDTMITFDGASGSQFVKYRDGVVCAATNYVCYINKNGEVEWEKNVAVTDPILRSEGDYFLVAQRNGTRFTLYKGEKTVFDKSTEYNILTGNVSSDGDVVLVTEKAGYKGAVMVYNKRGDNAFSWSSGSAQIISADISAGSRRVAAALLNTEGEAKSSVYMFNMRKTESYAQQEFPGTLIYKVDFKDNALDVFADSALIGMKQSGSVAYKIEFGDSEATRASLADNGDKLILFTGTNIPMLNIYNKNGKLKKTISSQKVPDFAYISDDNIVYNVDREVIMGKINAEIPYRYTAIMDIKGIVPVDNRSFLVIYSNSISMVRMKGVLW